MALVKRHLHNFFYFHDSYITYKIYKFQKNQVTLLARFKTHDFVILLPMHPGSLFCVHPVVCICAVVVRACAA